MGNTHVFSGEYQIVNPSHGSVAEDFSIIQEDIPLRSPRRLHCGELGDLGVIRASDTHDTILIDEGTGRVQIMQRLETISRCEDQKFRSESYEYIIR